MAAAPGQGGTAGTGWRGPRRERLRHPWDRQQAVGADGLGLAGMPRIDPCDGAALGMGIPPPEGALHHKRGRGLVFKLARPRWGGQQPGASDGDIDTKTANRAKNGVLDNRNSGPLWPGTHHRGGVIAGLRHGQRQQLLSHRYHQTRACSGTRPPFLDRAPVPGPGPGPGAQRRPQALGHPRTQPLCPLSRTRGLLVAVPSARRPNKGDKGSNPSLRHA